MKTILVLCLFFCIGAWARPYSVDFFDGEVDSPHSFRLSGPNISFNSMLFSNYTYFLIPNRTHRIEAAHREAAKLAEIVAEKLNSGDLTVEKVRALFERSLDWSEGTPNSSKGVVPPEIRTLYAEAKLDEYRVRNYVDFRGIKPKITPRIFGPGSEFDHGFDLEWGVLENHGIIMSASAKAHLLSDLALLLTHKKMALADIQKITNELKKSRPFHIVIVGETQKDIAHRFVETIKLESAGIRHSIRVRCVNFYFGK